MPDDTSRDVLPEIPVRDEMPWVKALNPTNRAIFEKRRAADIQKDHDAMVRKLRRLSAFDSLSDEAVEFIANDISVLARDSYENGIQDGGDTERMRQSASGSGLFAHEAVVSEPGAYAGGR